MCALPLRSLRPHATGCAADGQVETQVMLVGAVRCVVVRHCCYIVLHWIDDHLHRAVKAVVAYRTGWNGCINPRMAASRRSGGVGHPLPLPWGNVERGRECLRPMSACSRALFVCSRM